MSAPISDVEVEVGGPEFPLYRERTVVGRSVQAQLAQFGEIGKDVGNVAGALVVQVVETNAFEERQLLEDRKHLLAVEQSVVESGKRECDEVGVDRRATEKVEGLLPQGGRGGCDPEVQVVDVLVQSNDSGVELGALLKVWFWR